jgi:TolA-binding protein
MIFVLSFAVAQAQDLNQKSKEIDDLEKKLSQKVDDYNRALKEQHEKGKDCDIPVMKSPDAHTSPTPVASSSGDDVTIDILHNKMKELIGRIEDLELNLKKLASGDKNISFRTQEERDAATHKAAMLDKHDISDTKAMAQYNKAMEFLNKKKYAEAVRAFKEVIMVYPDDVYAKNASVRIADSYSAQGRYDEAIEFYEKIEGQIEGELYNDAILGKANALFESGEKRAACKVLNDFNRLNRPIDKKQNVRFQKQIVDFDCSSKYAYHKPKPAGEGKEADVKADDASHDLDKTADDAKTKKDDAKD